jgi:hypothetical protein
MLRGKSPGPSGIRVQDILFWHHKPPEVWDEFVCLIQDCFWGKPLPQEFLYSILCLIPKTESMSLIYCRKEPPELQKGVRVLQRLG